MSISLSSEAQAKASQIPDIAARLERFIDEQFALEQWRAKRWRPEVMELVQEAIAEGSNGGRNNFPVLVGAGGMPRT